MTYECRALSSSLRRPSLETGPSLRGPSSTKIPTVLSNLANTGLPRPHPILAARSIRHVSAAVSTSNPSKEDDVSVSFPSTPLVVPYPEAQAPEVLIVKEATSQELSKSVGEYIVEASREAVAERGVFVVALSGGSLPKLLSVLTSEPYVSQIDWPKWYVLWGDERFVKHTSDDSNFKQAATSFLGKVPIPADQVLPTDDEFSTAEEVAQDYEALLRVLVEDKVLSTTGGDPFPRLDLVLLGIGPEGHTASIFPNSSAVRNTTRWVVPVLSAPKAPPQRVTFTLPVINAARKVAFVVTGKGKSEVVQRVFERTALPGSLPAQLVRPYKGTVTWFLDEDAGSRLSETTWEDAKKYPFVKMK